LFTINDKPNEMRKILMIILAILFSFPIVQAQESSEKKAYIFKKNNIKFAMSDIVLKRITFKYEHIIGAEGKMSLLIPLSYSFGNLAEASQHIPTTFSGPVNYYNMVDYSDWYLGFGVNMYPAGQGKFRPYFGFEMHFGPAHTYVEKTNDSDTKNDVEFEKVSYFQNTVLINMGVVYEPVKDFIFGVNLGLGSSSTINDYKLQFVFAPKVLMGIRF